MNRTAFYLMVWMLQIHLLFAGHVYAQQGNDAQDSLKQILTSAESDSARVDALNGLVLHFMRADQPDSALKYGAEAIRYAVKAGYRSGLAEAFTNRGKTHNDQGNFPQAMKDYHEALKLFAALRDEKNEANMYNLIANAFHLQGDFPEALRNQYSALKIREKIHDEEGKAWSYNNIGTIYRIQGDYEAALKNYHTSMGILEKMGDMKMVAIAYNNIGTVYTLQGKYKEALDSYFSALRIRDSLGNRNDIIASYMNVGDAFCDLYDKDTVTRQVQVEFPGNNIRVIPRQNWLDTAMNLQSRAHAMIEEQGNAYYSIFSLSGMGRIWFLRKNYPQSVKLYKEAYAIAESEKALELQQEIAKYLADNYDRMNDFKNGMLWYVRYTAHKDSLADKLKSEDLLRTRMKYEFEKKESEARAVQDKKDALAKSELDKQRKMRNIFLGGFMLVLLFAGIFFYQRNNIRKEKVRSDTLLLNILPSEIANELKQTGASKSKSFKEVTVLFADFVNFTAISEKMSPQELVQELHTCFSAFDHILQKYRIEKIKTIGDAYMCAGGIPVPDPEHALRVVKAAIEIRDFINARGKEKQSKNEIPFQLRIGIHSGPVVAGIVGVKKYAYDIWGDTVNIAARMEQNSEPGKINISHKTYELIHDHFKCTYRGKIPAKHKGEIDMYFLEA